MVLAGQPIGLVCPLGTVGPSISAAYIPFRYIADARQRIEIYRKLAQATDKAGLRGLEQELRDRFGVLPRRWNCCCSWRSSKCWRASGASQ